MHFLPLVLAGATTALAFPQVLTPYTNTTGNSTVQDLYKRQSAPYTNTTENATAPVLFQRQSAPFTNITESPFNVTFHTLDKRQNATVPANITEDALNVTVPALDRRQTLVPTPTSNTTVHALDKRQTATTCGGVYYPRRSVQAALNAGCSYTRQGGQAGGSTYPHVYNNWEGFNFPVRGQYYEFPIQMGGAYDGGSPGADRVIYNAQCQYAGAITHRGARGNAFVGCTGTS